MATITEEDTPENVRQLSDGVETRTIDIISDGTRLSGDLFYHEGLSEGDNRPGLILCHGWGGLKEHLNLAYAPQMAAAGYMVMTFDYRGWGESDSRLVIKGEMPEPDAKGEVTVTARAIRQLVDPMDQTRDIMSCIDYLTGEPGVDPNRIGLWGSSYGGGHVVYIAANDDRVKCVVAQVSGQDSRGIPMLMGGMEAVRKDASQRARGEIDPVPQGVYQIPGLEGTPYIARQASYAPVEHAYNIKVPILIIDAEKEELMRPAENGGLVYQRVKDNVPARYEIFKGMTHYEVYEKGLVKARQMAIDWYDEHL